MVGGNRGAGSGHIWSIPSRPIVLRRRLSATSRIARRFSSGRRSRSTAGGIGEGRTGPAATYGRPLSAARRLRYSGYDAAAERAAKKQEMAA
jgi:hypothetical protein